MNQVLLGVLSGLIVMSVLGCSPQVDVTTARSAKQRSTSPDVSETDVAELSGGNRAFAFDLYRAVREQEGNLFYSPYSISAALAMTYAGARGETEREMARTLHFALPQNQLHPAFNRIDLELASRGEGAAAKDEQGFRLNVVNAIWGQEGYGFLDEYLDTLAENYGAGLRLLDFRGAAEASRITINEWVEEQTEERIKDLIPPGAVDATTRLVLTNAIYFNAAWEKQFSESSTREELFYRLDGTTVDVPMMRQTTRFGYAEGPGYQAVELPYDGGELAMLILLPEAGSLGEFEQQLDAEFVDAVLASRSWPEVELTMPKFEFESEFGLGETLQSMGMPTAFSGAADFSGMTGNRDLFISDVIHKAFVGVDEEGTEAAAATAVVVAEMAAPVEPEEPVVVTLDRPFVLLIRDIGTGTVLFVGRVVDPSI